MFKRANKITALLVAAASVMSIVPAMAADSTRLGTKSGTINDAIAYKDGKYAFEGYKTDADNKSVYFNDGTKDKEINDLTDARINENSKYDASSTISWDGNDEYLLDLSTGKVTDEDVASDLQSTATDKLLAKLKKTDRYGANLSVSTERITPDQFGDVWYSYVSNNGTASKTGAQKAVITETPAVFTADIKVAGTTFKAASTPVGAGFNSGSKSSFAVLAQAATYTGDTATITGNEPSNGSITIAYGTPITKAVADTLQGLSANVTITQVPSATVVNEVDAIIVKINDATLPASIKYEAAQPVNSFAVATAAIPGFSTPAEFAAVVNSGVYPVAGYDVKANATTGVVTLTQKVESDFNAANLAAAAANYTVAPVLVTPGYTGTGATSTKSYNGYTNKSAAYIDVDKTANLRVLVAGKMVKLDEFDENVNDDGVKAVVTDSYTLAQDKDYIYRVAYVNFTGSTAVIKNSKNTATIFDAANSIDNTRVYLQKISKAQGETEKDAYLPKSVESYELSSDLNDGDIALGKEKLENAIGTVSNGKDFVGVRVVDGAVYYTEADSATKIKTYKFKFSKNEKIEISTNNKVDAYVMKKDADKDHDVKGAAGVLAGSSFDVNGNLWIINEGKIYESVKAGDFTEKFTCDRSIDSLDVYDEGSLVAWDESGDVYTTFQEGTKVTQDEATVVAPVVVTGWVQDGANWSFNDATGTKVTNKWVNVGGAWYFLKADGVMATGWYNDNGTWYFLKSSGAMATGWYNDNGTWYYLNASGAMLANTTVDGYVLNASGAWVK